MSKKDIISAVLIDSDDELDFSEIIIQKETKQEEIKQEETKQEEKLKQRKPRTVKPKVELNTNFNINPDIIEIGIDEVGRGPLFGRVYASAVVLPKSNEFNHSEMKDSKNLVLKKR